ncbi:MAG: SoxR reducing system RseC family protein [Deltaproteobacteria bacterium]|jgi:sigma-E factor negative regulatory protein RseC|nr:SoxR reducing system RseC family protein [Deltaproteobacteria bacterium]
MIEEVGTVVEIQGQSKAVVLCEKSSLCEHCATSAACSIGDDDRHRLVTVHNPVHAVVGDRVKIATSTGTFLKSSFVIYIVPLIALVLGAIIGKLTGESFVTSVDPNLLSAIFGVFFLVGSFLIIRVGSTALKKDVYMPKILEVLREVSSPDK